MRSLSVLCLALLVSACEPPTDDEPLAQTADAVVTCQTNGVTLYVRHSAQPRGTGTSAAPFQTVPQALAYAQATAICNFTVYVFDGTYPEDVTIDRNVTIRGESRAGVSISGRIFNATTASLTLDRLTLSHAAAPGALVVTGASSTTVHDVTITDASRRGIYQSAGTLVIIGSRIEHTVPTGATAGEGAGLLVRGGVQALLSNVSFSFNAQAIYATSAGTKVTASNLNVQAQVHNPAIIPATSAMGLAAIEVSSGATLLAEYCIWNDNQFVTLLVRDGARAHVRHADIYATAQLDYAGDTFGGDNIWVAGANSALEIEDFESRLAFVGVGFAGGGIVTESYGQVQDNDIGVHFDAGTPAGAFTCAQGTMMSFKWNGINFNGDLLPTPPVGGDPFVCPTVPWI